MTGPWRVAVGVLATILLAACTSPAPEVSSPSPTSPEASPVATASSEFTPSAQAPTPEQTLSASDSMRVTSRGGTITADIPQSWEYSAPGADRRASSGGVVDVLGVWAVETPDGEHRVTVEADTQGTTTFDARSYYAAFFTNTDPGLSQKVDHDFFAAADGSEGLWIAATAEEGSTAADEVAFFLFTPGRIVVGRAAATAHMNALVATTLRELATSIKP